MPYIASPIWMYHYTWHVSLSFIPFVVAIVNIVKCVKVKLGRTYMKTNVKKKFLLLLLIFTCVLLSNYYIEMKDVASCWFCVHRQRTNKKNILINKSIFKIYFLYHWNSGIVILLLYIWLNNEHYIHSNWCVIYRKINAIFYKDRTNIIIQASFKINKTLNTLTNISFWMIFRDGKNSSHSLTLVTFVVLPFVHMAYEKKNSYVFFHLREGRRNSTRFKSFYVSVTYCKSLVIHCESFLVTNASIYLTTISVIFWTLLESNFGIDSYL